MKIKNQNLHIELLKLIIFINYLFLSLIFFPNFYENRNNSSNIQEISIKSSADPKIFINNNWASSGFPGAGTFSNPYIIRDKIIDGGDTGNCIEIVNTDEYFRIENCSLYNFGSGISNAGIKLSNCSNGTITMNNITNNNGVGVFIDALSENNTIINNNLTHNADGIRLYLANNNFLIQNNLSFNQYYGIRANTNFSVIEDNFISQNGEAEIYLQNSEKNNISDNYIDVKANRIGIDIVSGSVGNTIEKNEIIGGSDGIIITGSSNYTQIVSNEIKAYTSKGIFIENITSSVCYDTKVWNNQFEKTSGINAQDNGTNTMWDNGVIGNSWNDYSGVDSNDDGIGDSPYIIDIHRDIKDNFPIYHDQDDIAPMITIKTPINNQIFTKSDEPPGYNIQVTDQLLDKKWYTLDGGKTNFTFTNQVGTINDTAWASLPDKNATITFYANDSLNRLSSKDLYIIKDTHGPSITINSPETNTTYSEAPPQFSVSIADISLGTKWYTINEGTHEYNFTSSTVNIDEDEWEALAEGTVNITFHANDTLGRTTSLMIQLIKDTLSPIITIRTPSINDTYTEEYPEFEFSIEELHLDCVCLELESEIDNSSIMIIIPFVNISSSEIELTHTLSESNWGSFSDGLVTVTIYANDTAGNLSSEEITIIKGESEPTESSITFASPSMFILLSIVSIFGLMLVVTLKRKYRVKYC